MSKLLSDQKLYQELWDIMTYRVQAIGHAVYGKNAAINDILPLLRSQQKELLGQAREKIHKNRQQYGDDNGPGDKFRGYSAATEATFKTLDTIEESL